MYPDLFGIPDFSYILLVIIGIVSAVIFLILYLKKQNFSRNTIIDVVACTFFAISIGIVGAILFQNLYDLISDPANYHFAFKMTFYGGLIAGALGFILLFNLFVKKHNDIRFKEILIVAPVCITSAHAFGRIGCFLAGCCYGKETDSCIGVNFPGLIGKRIPTQLIESIFLFVLTAVLVFLIFKMQFKWTMVLYLGSYSIFRFIIEFFRGDAERGGTFLNLYPSQIICVFIWILIVPLIFVIKKFVFYSDKQYDKE